MALQNSSNKGGLQRLTLVSHTMAKMMQWGLHEHIPASSVEPESILKALLTFKEINQSSVKIVRASHPS